MPHPLRHTSATNTNTSASGFQATLIIQHPSGRLPLRYYTVPVIHPFIPLQASKATRSKAAEVEGQPPPPRMCLPLDYWLCCMSRTVNDDPAPARRTRTGGASYYTGNGYHATAAEAYRKAASNNVRRGPAAHHAGAVAPAAATRGWHGHHAPATGAQEKIAVAAYPYAGAEETLKQQPLIPAAWNGRVGGHGARGGAPHNYYYERAQLPAHRGAAADSHYTAAAAAATADHERY